MSDPTTPPVSAEAAKAAQANYRHGLLYCFGLFFIFFIFYVGAAVIQTPPCAAFASIPVAGMPLGLLLSMLIFPVSWILIFIYFKKGR